jgi:hypothetical protein
MGRRVAHRYNITPIAGDAARRSTRGSEPPSDPRTGKEGFLADVRDHATGAIDGLLPGAWAAARDE